MSLHLSFAQHLMTNYYSHRSVHQQQQHRTVDPTRRYSPSPGPSHSPYHHTKPSVRHQYLYDAPIAGPSWLDRKNYISLEDDDSCDDNDESDYDRD